MNKLLLSIFSLIFFLSCSEKYPKELTKDLPFCTEYYISKDRCDSIIDSLIKTNTLKEFNDDSYEYHLKCVDGTVSNMKVTFLFNNDSLYSIEIREISFLNKRDDEENYKTAIEFFKSNEIGLSSYKKEKNDLSDGYTWTNGKYSIDIFTKSYLDIIFMDNDIKDRISKSDFKFRSVDKDEYCKSIIDEEIGIYNATVTDANILIIGVKPIGEPNFDILAESYLKSAIKNGLQVKGCMIVDINNSEWGNGFVKGERIGKAFR